MIKAVSADGVIHEFPDDTPDDVIDSAMGDYASRQTPGYKSERARADASYQKMPVTFGRNMLAPFQDEIAGGVAAGGQALRNVVDWASGKPSKATIGDAYRAHSDAAKSAFGQYAKDNPVSNIGSQIIGGLSLAPTKAAALGKGLLDAIRVNATQGAIGGGIWGAADGDSLEDRATGGATNAAIGTGVGVAAPLAIKGGGALIKGIADVARGAHRAVGLSTQTAEEALGTAVDYLGKSVARDGLDPATLTHALNKNRAGNMTLADVGGENMTAAARTAAQSPGPARNIVTQFAKERQLGQRGRITEQTKASFGGTDTYGQAAKIRAGQKAKASGDFRSALGSGVVRSKALSSLFQSPTMKSALPFAQKIAGDEYALARAQNKLGAADTEDWAKAVSDLPNKTAFPAKYLHHIKQGLDSHLESFRDPITKTINYKDPSVMAADNIRKAFRGEIKRLNTRYADALDNFSSKARVLTAQRDGEAALRMDAEEIATLKANFDSPDELKQFKIGFGRSLQDMIEGTRDRTNAAQQIIGNEKMRKRITAVLGRDSAKYIRGLMREDRKFELGAALGGSQSVPRALDEADMSGHTLANAASKMSSGKSAFDAALSWLGNKYDSVSGMTEQVKEKLAHMLISEDPEIQRRALSEIAARMAKKSKRPAAYIPGGVTGSGTQQMRPSE